jgi:hypothetical protein
MSEKVWIVTDRWDEHVWPIVGVFASLDGAAARVAGDRFPEYLHVEEWELTPHPMPSLANGEMEPEKPGGEGEYEHLKPMIVTLQNYENYAVALRKGWNGDKRLAPIPDPDLEATILAMAPEE